MGSKSSKWLAAALAASALAVVPAGAVAKLDYSRNSVSGQDLPAPAVLDYSRNSVSGQDLPAPAVVHVQQAPAATPKVVRPDAGFSWGDALAGGGIVLLLALSGTAIVRRRHAAPLVS